MARGRRWAVKTVEVLEKAKALLTPETWGKGHGSQLPAAGKYCVLQAMGAVARGFDWRDMEAADALLAEAFGARFGLAGWNDAPERTLEEVHALIDRAVAYAKAQEGGR